MEFDLSAEANAKTKILITRRDSLVDGWENKVLPNLNELLKTIPDKINVNIRAGVASDVYSVLNFGEDMAFNGEYEVNLPLAFDDMRLEYTYTIEEPFGKNDAENGYEDVSADENTIIKEIRGVSLSMNVKNSIPIGFAPSIIIVLIVISYSIFLLYHIFFSKKKER